MARPSLSISVLKPLENGGGLEEASVMIGKQPSEDRKVGVIKTLTALALMVLSMGCGDDGNGVGNLRFGQVGEVRVVLQVPLLFRGGEGELHQALTWNSGGTWQVDEAIYYRSLVGDENRERSEDEPAEYAYLITQLHEPPLALFEGLETEPVETCPRGDTKVTLTLWDDFHQEQKTWVRCAEGSLGTLNTSEAGPDADAVRVIQAAILVRNYSVGPEFISAYSGSVPFGTLDRGEDSSALLEEPRAFFSRVEGTLDTPAGWVEFWRAHVGSPTAQPPVVDWANEMVVVAAAGKRSEAGDSVEVRRVLQTGEGTLVTLFERIPGDFCSPAARDHYPVHIVVSPRTLLPIEFSDLVPERVPCGF